MSARVLVAALVLLLAPPATATALTPAPGKAAKDRGRVFADGCHLKGAGKDRSPGRRCVYARRSAERTFVNLGDSHGLMYAPAAIGVAKRERARLVNLTKAGCAVADVRARRDCERWRGRALRRIERIRPALVIVSTGTNGAKGGGDRLERGFARTLKRLERTGAAVAVLRDMPRARKDVIRCIKRNRTRLGRCAHAKRRSKARSFDAGAARSVKGVRLIDPADRLCPRRCPAVIGGKVVYRNDYHLTATYARSLTGWLHGRLPAMRR